MVSLKKKTVLVTQLVKKKFGVSHGVDMITGQSVVLPCVSHPELLGAKFDQTLGEWVVNDE